MRFEIFKFQILILILFISGCGPKVTQYVIDYPIFKAHVHDLYSDKKSDISLNALEPNGTQKWNCFSPDDMAEFMRGNTAGLSICVIVSVKDDIIYCTLGSITTTLFAINKYTCFTSDDLATLARYVKAK